MPFIYKPGAGGAVGASFVAKAKPDGYTLMGASMSPVIISPLTKEGLDYTSNDFTPICRISSEPTVLSVKPDSRWKTLGEMIQEAKKSPGKITYSTSAVFGTTHVPMELLQKLGGFNMTHIPTTGSGPALTAALGGHVDMVVTPAVAVTSHLKSGSLRPVACIGRLKEFPNVPTLQELGYPVFYTGWMGLVGPKGIPEEIMNTIYKACDKVMEVHKKSLEEYTTNLGSTPAYVKGEEFDKELKSYYTVTKNIVEALTPPKK